MKIKKTSVLIFMARLKLKQADLAANSGVSKQTISAVMNGRSCKPEIVGKIAEGLGVDPTDIIEIED